MSFRNVLCFIKYKQKLRRVTNVFEISTTKIFDWPKECSNR